MVRLQRFLSQARAVSRREAERLIAAGAVRVNGKLVTELGVQVDPDRDRVELQGKRIKLDAPLYRLLLKPRECLSVLESPRDEDGRKRPSLERYLKDKEPGWIVVGPLDFGSEGMLLITSDGALAERIVKGIPGRRSGTPLTMTYHLKFQGLLSEDQIAQLGKGWRFEGRLIKPEGVYPLATTGKNMWVEIVVKELRPRALRAVGERLRLSVLKISRVKFGDFSFEGLKMGEFRDLNDKEVAQLQRAAGLRAPKENVLA
ncbi:MAG: hypothetical protein KA712_23035 [Myxococcales bacterium]|nr:hypothetical protein [Myxococcales bacterium]